jgi:hypothetical protein
MTKRFAKKGEWVTCENGHPICVAIRNINEADIFVPTHLAAWQQPEPKCGDVSPVCARCGAAFWHSYGGGQHFHFKDGWRSRNPDGSENGLWQKIVNLLK